LAALEKPEKDIGFSTHWEKFYKPVELQVVKRAALRNFLGDTEGFYNRMNNTVVLADDHFEILPSGGSVGKLKPEGAEVLAHELRHSTQDGSMKPAGRSQQASRTKAEGDTDEYRNLYMSDPTEIGVRVAALKNYMKSETLRKVASEAAASFGKNEKSNKVMTDFMNALIDSAGGNEKVLLNRILNDDSFAAWAKSEAGRNLLKDYKHLNNEKMDQVAKISLKILRQGLSDKNGDVGSLLRHMDTMSASSRAKYIEEILNYYNTVVMGGGAGGEARA